MADGLTIEEAAQLGATDAPTPTSSGGGLTIEQAARLGTTDYMGTGEAAARLLYKHGTFGFEPGTDRAKTEQAEHEHPFLNLGTGAAAMIGQTALMGPVAAAAKGVQGATMLARGARGAGKALEYTMLPNAEARTALTSGRTGAKLAGNYSLAEELGHDLTSPEKTWGETAKDAAGAYAMGTALGFPLGAGAHGVSRAVSAGAARALPALKDVREAARAPGTQGARDLADTARMDKYGIQEFERLKADLADPEQAHRYAGLNIVEALEARRLQEMPHTGELKPEQRYSPNLRAAEQDAAQTLGEGRHEAVTKYGTRKNEMQASIQRDLEELTSRATAANPSALGTTIEQLGAGAQRAPTHAELPGIIERAFGAAPADAQAAEAASAARRAQFDQRFARLRSRPPVYTTALSEVANKDPMLKSAIAEAAQQNERRAAIAAMENPSGAGGMRPYIEGQATAESQTLANRLAEGIRTGKVPPEVAPPAGGHNTGFNILDPQAITDIHHFLVLQSKNIADPVAQSRALQTKRFFSDWVESQFKGYKDLNNDYRVFMNTLEAAEHGGNLGLTASGRSGREAQGFFDRAVAEHSQAEAAARQAATSYQRSMDRFNRGEIRQPSTARLDNAVRAEQGRAGVVAEIRRGFGENLRNQIAGSSNPDSIIEKILTQAGQERLARVLGQAESRTLIDQALAMRAQRLGASTSLKPVASDEGVRFHGRMQSEGRGAAVEAYRNAYAQKIRNDSEAGKFDIKEVLKSPTAIRHLQDVFGSEQAGAFIREMLTHEATRQGATLALNAPKSHAASQFFDQIYSAGLTEQADAFRRAWAQTVASELEKASSSSQRGVNAVVDKLLTQGGKEQIRKMWGPDQGRKFIEQLYNKQAKAGLSQTLFGGSDTAYKLARNQKKDALMDAVYNLRPWNPHPFEALKNLRELGSAAYKQRRADQANRLYAQQGPEDVSRVVDAVLANERMRNVANPYVRNPAVRAIGPAGAEGEDFLQRQYGKAPPPRRP